MINIKNFSINTLILKMILYFSGLGYLLYNFILYNKSNWIFLIVQFICFILIGYYIKKFMNYKFSVFISVISFLLSLLVIKINFIEFYEILLNSYRIKTIFYSLNIPLNVSVLFIAISISLLATTYLFFIINFLYNWLINIFKKYIRVTRNEWIVIMLISVFLIIFCFVIFSLSDVFYSNKYLYNYIYSSDSPWHLQNNTVWINMNHTENDLRQPLFAIFSLPLIGPFYLFANLFGSGSLVYAFIINIPQIILLVVSCYMITRILDIKNFKIKILILIILSLSYPVLLFSFMMEQYIIAVFYLLIYVYISINNNKSNELFLIASSGTLLTSGFLFFLSFRRPLFRKENLKKFISTFLLGLSCIMIFGNQTIFQTFIQKVDLFSSYTNVNISILDKSFQFFSFVGSCFFAPPARIDFSIINQVSWQMSNSHLFTIVGIIILVISLLGFCVSHKQKNSQVCLLWVFFSFILLFLIGWGSTENAMVLYSLYFGWAYFILIVQFLRYILKKINISFHSLKIAYIFLVFVLFSYNGMEIFKLVVDFAHVYYPI